MDKNNIPDEQKYDPESIKPLFRIVEERRMTVGELIAELQEYPADRPVHVSTPYGRTLIEIKSVDPVTDMETNQVNPVILIDTVKIETDDD